MKNFCMLYKVRKSTQEFTLVKLDWFKTWFKLNQCIFLL